MGRRGDQLRALLRERDGGRPLPVRPGRATRARAAPHPAAPSATASCGTPTCPTSARASSTATACTARGRPQAGPPVQSGEAADRSLCARAQRARPVERRTLRPRRADPTADPVGRARPTAPGAMPKCIVIEPAFSWGDDRPPRTPWSRTVIYECHVRGLTKLHPGRARAAARHLPRARHGPGPGAPARARRDRRRAHAGPPLRHRACTSRRAASPTTGATTRSPSSRRTRGYADGRPRQPGRRVQDHGEAPARRRHRGDPRRRLQPHRRGRRARPDAVAARHRQRRRTTGSIRTDRRRYVDFTGCGNSLNMLHPRTIQLIMDSLRYWVLEMHVDGFRFDLAPALARELYEVNQLGTFFDIIAQDPVLSRVKLIAEPWDLGPGGYQVGNFPIGWTEWNGKYRDTVRRFWRGDAGQLGELGYRLTGSSDLYGATSRSPYASINFVTCHDGFTLHDLVELRAQAQRGQRRGQPRRQRRQLEPQLGRRGRDRARATCCACATASRATCSRPWPSRRACPMLSARRRDRPHAARQQQRLLPGQRDQLGPLDARRPRRRSCSPSPARCSRSAAASGAPAAELLPRRAGVGRRHQGRHLAAARRRRDDGRGLEPARRARPRHADTRRGERRDRRPRASRRG